jgi:membrane associated rhomboid family serine protease
MEMNVEQFEVVTGLAATPVVIALVAAIGRAFPGIPRRLYPLVAIAFGVAWTVLAAAARGHVSWETPMTGIVVGLAASGLYSGAVKPVVMAR